MRWSIAQACSPSPGARTCARCSRPGRGGDDDAALAVAIYLHHLTAGIAQMVATLGGLDVIVFTGGVGENAPRIRERAEAGPGYPRPRCASTRGHRDRPRRASRPQGWQRPA